MKILLVNDDGINAKGIRTLAEELSKEHEIYIVAPDSEKSGASQSATYFSKELTITKIEDIPNIVEAYSVSGTPADCSYVALNYLLKDKIDIVISGINHGWNLSLDCYYSGTIGAAREALFMGIPAIATSLGSKDEEGFKVAAKIVKNLIPVYMNDSNKLNYVMNINVPYVKGQKLKGIKVIGFEKEWKYKNDIIKTTIDENKFKLRFSGKEMHGNILSDEIVGDASLCHNGYASVTPLSLNMDAKEYHSELESLLNSEYKK